MRLSNVINSNADKMMPEKLQSIKELVVKADWNTLVTTYNESDLVSLLPFKELMVITHKMLYNDDWDEDWQNFATNLLQLMRLERKSEWQSDWRNEAFLGTACDVTLRYNDRYKAFKNAYDFSGDYSPELALEVAKCINCPGKPPINKREAIRILEENLPKYPFIEGASFLLRLYKDHEDPISMADTIRMEHWDKKLNELRTQNIHARSIEPKYFQDIYSSEKQ